MKTRLQLQGELVKADANVQKVYNNVFDVFRKTWKNEGIRGLQRGLMPAYGYQILLNGCRLGECACERSERAGELGSTGVGEWRVGVGYGPSERESRRAESALAVGGPREVGQETRGTANVWSCMASLAVAIC